METENNTTGDGVTGQENIFRYTYSAPQHDEIRRIREKYLPKTETPLERLRRLDALTTRKGMALSLTAGSLGALVMGIGMCCCMVWGGALFVPGILLGMAGLIGAGMAYPVYETVTRKERARIAPEILRLTDDLL